MAWELSMMAWELSKMEQRGQERCSLVQGRLASEAVRRRGQGALLPGR